MPLIRYNAPASTEAIQTTSLEPDTTKAGFTHRITYLANGISYVGWLTLESEIVVPPVTNLVGVAQSDGTSVYLTWTNP